MIRGRIFKWNDSDSGPKVRVTGWKSELRTKSRRYSRADPQNPNRIAQRRAPNGVWVLLQKPPLKAFLNPPKLFGYVVFFWVSGPSGWHSTSQGSTRGAYNEPHARWSSQHTTGLTTGVFARPHARSPRNDNKISLDYQTCALKFLLSCRFPRQNPEPLKYKKNCPATNFCLTVLFFPHQISLVVVSPQNKGLNESDKPLGPSPLDKFHQNKRGKKSLPDSVGQKSSDWEFWGSGKNCVFWTILLSPHNSPPSKTQILFSCRRAVSDMHEGSVCLGSVPGTV